MRMEHCIERPGYRISLELERLFACVNDKVENFGVALNMFLGYRPWRDEPREVALLGTYLYVEPVWYCSRLMPGAAR
jgi:hypothetical protein